MSSHEPASPARIVAFLEVELGFLIMAAEINRGDANRRLNAIDNSWRAWLPRGDPSDVRLISPPNCACRFAVETPSSTGCAPGPFARGRPSVGSACSSVPNYWMPEFPMAGCACAWFTSPKQA
jgi:hypothetical protein